ncbi:hypothetical protein CBR_g20422 [Chara braunii]|uniref:Uncharacterized protein n=1 Tax=Chara braunii TaxID=69332 RepID=A0A388JUB5_CHABU|nr:hypothetical protein CBR_g20422 [Chara braunii]|eukprot:GBG61391.1 hypothetical protein CBR_g20422 [Chara braunii]
MAVSVPSASSMAVARATVGAGEVSLRRVGAGGGGAKLVVKPLTGSSSSSRRWRAQGVRAQSSSSEKPLYIGYNPKKTVFPAEACDELGGEFCNVEGVGEEVNPQTSASAAPAAAEQQPQAGPAGIFASIFGKGAAENPDREYMEYDSPKTVFPGEACDDLGGEFCSPDFQEGVFPDTKPKDA